MVSQRWYTTLIRAALGVQERNKERNEEVYEDEIQRCRPDGFLVWFQVETAEQGLVALPVISRCAQGLSGRGELQVLVTANKAGCSVLQGLLPEQVRLLETLPGFVPAIKIFLGQWQPNVAIFMQQLDVTLTDYAVFASSVSPAADHQSDLIPAMQDPELQPVVLNACREQGIWLAWLDARIPVPQFLRYQGKQQARANVNKLLCMFDLILPETDVDVARLLMLGGALAQMPAWYVELSYAQALEACALLARQPLSATCRLLQEAKADRTVWLAANVSTDEVSAGLELHGALRARFSNLLTVLAPKDFAQAPQAAAEFTAQGLTVTLWSDICQERQGLVGIEVVVLDVAGLLPQLYQTLEVVFMGDSMAEDAKGSRLHEVAAAGCAVVTGSCSAVFLEAYDLNQAAVRAAEEWDVSAESYMSTSPSQEDQRCPNPTPRRAAGPPENGFGSDSGSSSLPRIRTVPEEEVVMQADLPSSLTGENSQTEQSMAAPASLFQNWRFSPINSPSGGSNEVAAAARSVGGGWRRTTSLRTTGSSENASSMMPERSMGGLERVPLSVLLRRTGSSVSNNGRVSDDASPTPSGPSQGTTTLFTARWPTVRRYEDQSVMPVWQLPQHPRGPCIWQVQEAEELRQALELLLAEPLQRRSQGHAAVQAAAKIGNGMLTIAWEVLVIMVLEPALAGMQTRAMSQPAALLKKERSMVEHPADDDMIPSVLSPSAA
ncbi:hypothetical protein WJX77_007796 [Trebouxia sp. C0004]